MNNGAILYHSAIADSFDNNYSQNPNFEERYFVWKEIFIKYFNKKKLKILDLGCGSGNLSLMMHDLGHSVVGVDGSENMVERCKEKISLSNLNNINFSHAFLPFSKIDLPKQLFQVVTASSVMEYISDVDVLVKQVNGLLDDNGYFIFSIPNKKSLYRKFEILSFKLIGKPAYLKHVVYNKSLTEACKLLNTCGFNIVETIYFGSKKGLNKIISKIVSKPYSASLVCLVCTKSV